MLPSLREINYYPSIDDPDFYRKIYNKAEFSLYPNRSAKFIKNVNQIKPHQLFVKNFMSPASRYNGLLLFFDTGSGKTCASLQIAEQLRPYIREKGGRIIVLGTSKDHVKKIFEREMYDVDKEIREMSNKLQPGASHCLGATYLSGDSTRLIDDNSFSINAQHSKDSTNDIYEFFGFQQFHRYVAELEKSHKFLNEVFANCVFIIDEAHNLSGLELDVSTEENASVLDDTESMIDDSQGQDDELTFQAEKLRYKIIDLKRQMTQHLVTSQKLFEELEFGYISSDVMIEKIGELKKLSQSLNNEYKELKKRLADILSRQQIIDSVVKEWLYQKIDNGGTFRLEELYTLGARPQAQPQIVQVFSQNKIIEFLRKIDVTSGLRNEYVSFLKEIRNEKNSAKIDGLKAYQAIKKVLISLSGSKIILLTATPMRDRADSIVNLINILRVNDGKHELATSELFDQGQKVNKRALEQAVTGYVSRYRVDSANFPLVVWDLGSHPNIEDRNILNILPGAAQLGIEPFRLKLNASRKYSPTIVLLGCRSKPESPQDQEYFRYLEYIKSQSKSPVQLLEYRCNFAFPLEKSMGLDRYPEDYYFGQYMMRYTMQDYFSKLLSFEVRGNVVSKFSYLNEMVTGRFLDLEQVGNYSAKLATLVDVLNAVSVRDGESGGMNLIYSKSTWFGCYLIALILENMGYRKYPRGSVWQNPPSARLCCRCNRLESSHSSEDNVCAFKQAYYIFAVGSSAEVSRYMSVLTSEENVRGELVKVVVGTKTITEGLDFKFIRYVHVFEPWYNFTRLDQLAGRGSRQGSHLQLPESTGDNYKWRNVTMLLYCYLHSQTDLTTCLARTSGAVAEDEGFEICDHKNYSSTCMFTRDITNYLTTLKKDCEIKQVERILCQQAVDCPLNLDINSSSSDKDSFTRKCYYNKCGMNCAYLPPSLSMKISSAEIILQWADNNVVLTNQTSLEDVGIYTPVVGAKSGRLYLTNRPYLSQLKKYGDWTDMSVVGGVDSVVVGWMIEPKDYSTFYLLFYETIAKHLIGLLQYILVYQYGEKQPIVRLSHLTQEIQSRLSFNLEPAILAGMISYAMNLMSGVYRPTKYAVSGFIIVPLAIQENNNATVPNDTYYILHPDDIQLLDSTMYHKYVWPKTVRRGRKDVDISKWILPDKMLMGDSFAVDGSATHPAVDGSATHPAVDGFAVQTRMVSSELMEILQDYFRFINDNPWNKYEMYVHFMKEYHFRDTVKFETALVDPYYKPSYILHQLIINQFGTEDQRLRLVCTRYLAHYLEYQSVTQITVCDCQNYFHHPLNRQSDANFRFLFEYRNLSTGRLDVIINDSGLQFQISGANIQTFHDTRQPSPIAIGDVKITKTTPTPYLRITNNLANAAIHGKIGKGFHQNCLTSFVSKTGDQETPARPGLIMAYNELAIEAKKISILNVAPPLYHIVENGSYYVYELGPDGKATSTVIATKQHENAFKRDILCPGIELLLHYLNDYHPRYFYFDYKIPITTASELSTTKSSTVDASVVKRKGRKKKDG